jgi:hypothetical protein
MLVPTRYTPKPTPANRAGTHRPCQTLKSYFIFSTFFDVAIAFFPSVAGNINKRVTIKNFVRLSEAAGIAAK